METKRCACKTHKGDPIQPVTEFYKRKRSKDGLHTWCKACCRANARAHTPKAKRIASHRRSHMKITYELTELEYQNFMTVQDGKCAICRDELGDRKDIMIDHNHKTGEARGLLCRSCNTGLGFFKDSELILFFAREYVHNNGVKDGPKAVD